LKPVRGRGSELLGWVGSVVRSARQGIKRRLRTFSCLTDIIVCKGGVGSWRNLLKDNQKPQAIGFKKWHTQKLVDVSEREKQ
jgi:hypothetical protein